MKIFITGNTGFVGRELVKKLSGKHEIVGYHISNKQDLLNYEKLKNAMKGCDIVVHLAAIKKPLEDKTFYDYFKINCIGTFNAVHAAMENKAKRFIFASSMTYYGIERGIPCPYHILENTGILTQRVKTEEFKGTRDCDVAYSTSKVIGEQILANYGMRKKLEVIILRFGPVRKMGEYRPFGELKLHLKINNAVQALEKAIETDKKLWYEAFNIADNIDGVDISKAKEIMGYDPR